MKPNKDDLLIKWLGLEIRANGGTAIAAVVILALLYFGKHWLAG
jgi:hypothetical protein